MPSLLDQVREPFFERAGAVLPLALLATGAAVLTLVLSGALGGASGGAAPGPPPVAVTPTPVPGVSPMPAASAMQIVSLRSDRQSRRDATRFARSRTTHVPARWEASFYPLYEAAARTFGVNWLLLASIHKQETAFSTDPSTYHGLNFARCCGGPMQMNVTNGRVSTWKLVRDSYRYAQRPAGYAHPTARHPSIYDDFDAIMAAARLLAADGASAGLDAGAWWAAYDYYGHDATGVTYADQVLARAISWSQHGFCINCALDAGMVSAVHAAYGAPVLALLRPAARTSPARPRVMAETARARPAQRSRTPRSR